MRSAEINQKIMYKGSNTQPLQKLYMALFSLIIVHAMMPIIGRFISTYLTTYFMLAVVMMIILYFLQWRFREWVSIFSSLLCIQAINATYSIVQGGSIVLILYGVLLTLCPMLIGLRLKNLPAVQTKTLFKVAAAAVVITTITTVHGLSTHPGAARMMATFEDSQNPMLIRFEWLNIGGFSFTYILLTIYPIIIGYVRQRYNKLWLKILIIWLFATYFMSAEYMTALSGFVLISSLWFIPKNFPHKKLFVILGVILLLFTASKVLMADMLYDFAASSNSTILQERMLYMADGLAGVENTSDVGSREDMLMRSLEGFLSSPIFGNFYKGGHIGGHSYILDFLSLYGLVGLILLVKSYKAIFNTFFKNYKDTPYYTYALMSFFTAIVLSTVNTGNHWFELTLLVPLAIKMIYITRK